MSTNGSGAPRPAGPTSFARGILLPRAETPRATAAVGLVVIVLLLVQLGQAMLAADDGVVRLVLVAGVAVLALETGRRILLLGAGRRADVEADGRPTIAHASATGSGRRWTALEDDARPGQTFNSEAGAGVVDATLKTFGSLGPLIGAYELHEWERKGQGIELVAAREAMIVTTRDASVTVPWAEVVRVNLARFPVRSGPVLTVDTADGGTIEIPDQLYVDALGDFASMRHKERVRTIADELRGHIVAPGVDGDGPPVTVHLS